MATGLRLEPVNSPQRSVFAMSFGPAGMSLSASDMGAGQNAP